jgi:hypothetical protein
MVGVVHPVPLPDMTVEAFARDAEWVERDLRALKELLEG